MITYIVCFVVFAFLYAIKGGSGPYVFEWWNKIRHTNAITERLLDGKVISTIGAFVFALIATADLVTLNGDRGVAEYTVNTEIALKIAAAWLLSVAPSMGEEHGAVGTTQLAWGDYLRWMPDQRRIKIFGKVIFSYLEGREYGVKKAVQRGVWIGALMTLATGYIPFILFSFLFVPCVFAGQELYYRLTKQKGPVSWVLSEPIIGGVVYGLPMAGYLLS